MTPTPYLQRYTCTHVWRYSCKCIPMIALCCHYSGIMADFLMPEIQQPIIDYLHVHVLSLLSKDLVEL